VKRATLHAAPGVSSHHGGTALVVLSLLLLNWADSASAQDLAPRAYWPAPVGTRILIVGYQNSSGDVVTDPSLPVTGVDSTIHTGVLGYQHTFDLFGRTGTLQLQLPYVDGTTTGMVASQPGRRDVNGLGDVTATLSINLLGAPAMTRGEFRALLADPHPLLGASIRVVAPTGEYDADRLINIGTNRWAVRGQLGAIVPFAPRWMLEMSLGIWWFQDNDQFLGMTREQDPIGGLNISLVRGFGGTLWASLDANYYVGGRTTVGADRNADLQRNSRLGITIFYPLKGRHALKANISEGVVTESGGDFRMIGLTYLYAIP